MIPNTLSNVLNGNCVIIKDWVNRINSVNSYIKEAIKESCFLDSDSFNNIISNYDYLSENFLCCNLVGNFLDNDFAFMDLDLKKSNYFKDFDLNLFYSEDVLSKLFLEFKSIVNDDSLSDFFYKKKLELGIKYFSSGDYYTSVGFFLKLIDSLSIKRLLKNEELGVRHNNDEIKTTLRVSVNAICDILLNNLVIEYSGKVKYSCFSLKDKKFNLKREKDGSVALNCVTGYKDYLKEDTRYLFVSYSLLKTLSILYALAPWRDGKPNLFNRHWYEHGMYDVDDVSKEDCIKVMFICFHMLMLYSILDK